VAHDWERCNALAEELVTAARDVRREADTVAMADLLHAFHPVAQRLWEIGVPASAICNALRSCANSIEGLAEVEAAREAEVKPPRLVLVSSLHDDRRA
jgi:hypothetical protein